MKTTPIIRSWRNSSEYQDAWARPCIAWLCRRLDVRSAHVQITNTRPRGGNGRAWLCANRVLLRLNRRHPRLEWQYSTMSWDRSRPVSGTLEAFVFLAAHELAHISPEGKHLYSTCEAQRHTPGRGHWRQRMEYATQSIATRLLGEYRDGGRDELLREYRKATAKAKAKAKARPPQPTADQRLTRIAELALAWERRRTRAENAIKKLNRRRAGIIAAQTRKAAAHRPSA